MFRFSKPLLLNLAKQHSSVVGFDVIPNAREVLISLYERTIQIATAYPTHKTLNAVFAQNAKYRLCLLLENPDDEQFAARLQVKEIEMLVLYAEQELELMDRMNSQPIPRFTEEDDVVPAPFGTDQYGGVLTVSEIPENILDELRTRKVGRTRGTSLPVSVSYLRYYGIEPTEEEIAAAAEALILTPEEEAFVEQDKILHPNLWEQLLLESFARSPPIPQDLLEQQRYKG